MTPQCCSRPFQSDFQCRKEFRVPWGPAAEEDSQSPPPHSTPPPPIALPVPPFPAPPSVCVCASTTCGYLDVLTQYHAFVVLCHGASRFGTAFRQSLRMGMLTPMRGPTGVSFTYALPRVLFSFIGCMLTCDSTYFASGRRTTECFLFMLFGLQRAQKLSQRAASSR